MEISFLFKPLTRKGLERYSKNFWPCRKDSSIPGVKELLGDFEKQQRKAAKVDIKNYDGPEGPLFSSMVSCEVFSESDIVLGSVKQF